MTKARRTSASDQGASRNGDPGGADRPSSRLFRLFLLATLPPAMVVGVDECAIAYGTGTHWSSSSLALLYVLYVVQVGALTSFVGRFVSTWFLRWTILIWVLALIDLRLFTLALDRWQGCLIYAFLSGQLSLLVFVATLGPGAWPWRLPAVMVVGVIVLYALFGDRPWGEAWSAVLILQTLVTFPLFLLLLLLGFRIRYGPAGISSGPARAASRGFSFSVRHMLFWMLAAVPILTIGQRLSPIGVRNFDLITWLRLLFVAVCLSVVPLLVLVTIFSRKRVVYLAPISTLVIAGLGVVLAVSVTSQWVAPVGLRRSWQDWLIADLTDIGNWWIVWNLLSAAFLAGLLLLFRTAGYRLEHVRQARSPFAEHAD